MIATARLYLRKPTPNDADVLRDILSCPEQTRYLPNEAPYTDEQQQQYLYNRKQHWQEHGFGTFIICLKGAPDIKLGFSSVEFTPNPGFVDIRYGIAKRFEGQGFVTEAAQATVDWTFANTDQTRIFGVSMPENQSSIAVLKKLRMSEVQGVDLYGFSGLKNYCLDKRVN